LVSQSRQSSSTPVGFGQRFINKEQWYHPPSYPDLPAADIYLFLSAEISIEGTALL
jgi:hypothetical protein